MLLFVAATMTAVIASFYYFGANRVKYLKDHWSELRCNPLYMPMAGYAGVDVFTNFTPDITVDLASVPKRLPIDLSRWVADEVAQMSAPGLSALDRDDSDQIDQEIVRNGWVRLNDNSYTKKIGDNQSVVSTEFLNTYLRRYLNDVQ